MTEVARREPSSIRSHIVDGRVAACMPTLVVLASSEVAAEHVPVKSRCTKAGCAERWP